MYRFGIIVILKSVIVGYSPGFRGRCFERHNWKLTPIFGAAPWHIGMYYIGFCSGESNGNQNRYSRVRTRFRCPSLCDPEIAIRSRGTFISKRNPDPFDTLTYYLGHAGDNVLVWHCDSRRRESAGKHIELKTGVYKSA